MVGTVLEVVDMGADCAQLAIHPVVQTMNIIHAKVAAGDARLIGDDEDVIAEIVAQLDGLARSLHPFEVVDPVHIVLVDVEHTIAIEEYGRASQPVRQLASVMPRISGILHVEEGSATIWPRVARSAAELISHAGIDNPRMDRQSKLILACSPWRIRA
ncbi:hypothetical protein ABIF44_002477 [Bradyrhizobium japonicum]